VDAAPRDGGDNVKKQQLSFFDDSRMTATQALEMTRDSLRAYGSNFRHWAIAYSGGKDSTATVAAVVYLIESGAVKAPDSLTILYADTRMELPPLQICAMDVLAELQKRGYRTQVVLPKMDDRFFVYMFGRGVPPPSNTFRWCTAQLKIEPMMEALTELRAKIRGKLLMLTGVRIGESAARDDRIAISCGKNGSECGQGWFQETTPLDVADTLAPLLHWRTCLVWDFLMGFEAQHGLPTAPVAQVYGQDADGSALERDARTGCVGCNLASRDVALEIVLKSPQWRYLEPLRGLRPLYAELKRPENRLRKVGEKKADGSDVSNPGRLGPLTMEARHMGIDRVLMIQNEINLARPYGMPPYKLINQQELERIEEMIAANTWPQRWTGDEVNGGVLLPMMPTRGGGVQATLASVMEVL
jgi:DNA sulfur modification protein DndC